MEIALPPAKFLGEGELATEGEQQQDSDQEMHRPERQREPGGGGKGLSLSNPQQNRDDHETRCSRRDPADFRSSMEFRSFCWGGSPILPSMNARIGIAALWALLASAAPGMGRPLISSWPILKVRPMEVGR